VFRLLREAEAVFSSALTPVEATRALIRAEARRHVTPAEAHERRALLEGAVALWDLSRIDDQVTDRICMPFPVEPIRTLDAIHLASAILARAAVPDLALLSLDERVRANGRALGFTVLPP